MLQLQLKWLFFYLFSSVENYSFFRHLMLYRIEISCFTVESNTISFCLTKYSTWIHYLLLLIHHYFRFIEMSIYNDVLIFSVFLSFSSFFLIISEKWYACFTFVVVVVFVLANIRSNETINDFQRKKLCTNRNETDKLCDQFFSLFFTSSLINTDEKKNWGNQSEYLSFSFLILPFISV